MPRKFSEKIAIQQRKLNEDQSAFDQIMAEVHSITRKFEPDIVDVGLFPGNSLRAGRSLPNVHHLSSVSQCSYSDNYGWLNADNSSLECNDRFVIHPSRGRYPGSSYHYSPYHRSLSPQAVIPTDRSDDTLDRQDTRPLSNQRYLQPPPDSSWRRTHSDPVLNSSLTTGLSSSSYPVHALLNQSFSPPTHSPPLNDSSSCGSPLCEACASPYYTCPMHERLPNWPMISGEGATTSLGRELKANSFATDAASSPPTVNTTSPTETSTSDECSSGLLPLYSNHMLASGGQDGVDGLSALPQVQQYAQVQTQQQPRASFSQYREPTHSAPCSPCESVSTNEGQSSSPVPANISPSPSCFMLPSSLQNIFIEPVQLTEVPEYSYELMMMQNAIGNQSSAPLNSSDVVPAEYLQSANAGCSNIFQVPMVSDYGASVSHKGNIPDIILTGADGSIRNSSGISSPSTACSAYYGVPGDSSINSSLPISGTEMIFRQSSSREMSNRAD